MNVGLHSARDLNAISVCTGGGGLDLGVELAIPSVRPVLYVEREAFAVARLVAAIEEGHLAPAPVWTDARTVPGRRFRGCVDLVFGGIPCQPHSFAGKRLGREDERDLWSPTRRLIVQSGAWSVLIENVGGMLSSGGAERVWADLRRLGFRVAGGLFTAAEVGASQERERLFILGVADAAVRDRAGAGQSEASGRTAGQREHRGPGSRLGDADGARANPHAPQGGSWPATGQSGRSLVDAGSGGRDGRSEVSFWGALERAPVERPGGTPLFPPSPNDHDGWRSVLSVWPQAEPALCGMADGMAGRVDPLRMLGNGVVPLQAAYALRTLASRLAAESSSAMELVRMMGLDTEARAA